MVKKRDSLTMIEMLSGSISMENSAKITQK